MSNYRTVKSGKTHEEDCNMKDGRGGNRSKSELSFRFTRRPRDWRSDETPGPRPI